MYSPSTVATDGGGVAVGGMGVAVGSWGVGVPERPKEAQALNPKTRIRISLVKNRGCESIRRIIN